jgi:transglutaminase-like putative cysteine protease
MARSQGPSPRLQRLIAFGAISLLAAATAAAFGRVFVGRTPTLELLAAGVGSAALASLLERRSLLLATLVSGAAMVAAVGVLVFPATTWYGVPTLETLRAMREAATVVGEQARVQVAPTPPLEPLLLAAVTALWAAVFSAHALAARAGSPLLATLPPVALLAFADSVLEDRIRPLFGIPFLAAALAVVFLDGLRRVQRWGPIWAWPGAGRRLGARTTRGAWKVTGAVLVVATFAPVALPGFGARAILDLSTGDERDRIRIDPLVSIKAQLDRAEPLDLFLVTASEPSYWRLLSLDTFDGTAWRPGFTDSPATVLDGQFFESPVGETLVQRLEVLHDFDLVPGLPAAYRPVRVSGLGGLLYDPALHTVYGEDELTAGMVYEVTSDVPRPSPENLDSEVFPEAPPGDPFTQLPAGSAEIDLIRQIALDWTRDAPTDYRKILAIQDRLRDPTEFAYDEDVAPYDDAYAILDFLQVGRRGFCQQFAVAMAVMLRSLGIPARVAEGFTPGEPQEDGTFLVTTDNAHAWVEVRFPSYGWLAFEPTPTRANPAALDYYDPTRVGCDLGTIDPALCRPEDPRPGPPIEERSPGEEQRRRFENELLDAPVRCPRCGAPVDVPIPLPERFPWRVVWLGALGLAALAAAVVPPLRALRRRWRVRRAAGEPRRLILATYVAFADRAADLGLARGPGETLDEYGARLAASGLLQDGHLERLTAIAARAAYSAAEPSPDDPRVASAAADRTLRDLRRRTPLPRRLAGLYGYRR